MNGVSLTEEQTRRLLELGGSLPGSIQRPAQVLVSTAPGAETLLQEAAAVEERLHRQRQELDRVNAELQAARLRYRELVDFLPDCLILTDWAGVIQEANHSASALFNRPREFLTDKPLPLLLGLDGRSEVYRLLVRLRLRRAGTVEECVVCLPRPGQPPLHVSLTVSAIGGGDGSLCLRWMFRDVTGWIRTERALSDEKTLADSLLDAARSIVMVLDAHGRVLRFNRFLVLVSGYAESELLGRDAAELLLPENERLPARELLRQSLDHGVSHGLTGSLLCRDGERRAIAWSAKPLPAAPGERPAVLVVGHDITELQQAQRQALQAERLAAIGQMIAGLAHESRNALQRAQSCLERLTWRLQDSPEALDLVQRARAAQHDLARLFEEVRTYAAPLHPEWERCHLAEVWREAWAQVCAVEPQREATLHEEGCPEDLWCSADRFRLGQVFRNVLENALHAGPAAARVTVRCREVSLDSRRAALRVVFHDNGPGLSEEQAARIFEPFYTTKHRGSGLGMAIAKRIVEAHGGTLAARNSPHGGAEIVVTLPRDPS